MTIETKDAVRSYFERMAQIRSTGGATGETSFYSALENLLNAIGDTLKPKVVCNGQLRDQGAGHPDFGLYSKKQFTKGQPKAGQGEIPERGVIEVKSLADDVRQTAQGEQTTKYLNRYNLVLVTNYREFCLVGRGDDGKSVEREFFSLADSEQEFWTLAARPLKSAKDKAPHLGEFLKRVMMNAAPLTRSEDVAWFLASYARDALATLESKDSTPLEPLRKALETALGINLKNEKGVHFFRSTLVQTLFYGIFSAWVIHAKGGGGKFNWKLTSYILTVPMIRPLFEEVAKSTRLGSLGLLSVLDRTGEVLNRVDSVEFFETFHSDDAVQHFYEPFLEAFDPRLRKQMGVWYTPREIVRYMVERVDMVLRTELGLADGLADKNVYVLDPCCGTGAYVLEVLRKIEKTLRATKGEDALIGQDVQEAARERVFGFEIMSAPFVIAHWQVGNLLNELCAPFDPTEDERPAIYLTNALTGWEPLDEVKETLFPELDREGSQAGRVKRDVPILVVLGNPPYNSFAGVSPEEEAGLVEPYKDGLSKKWKIGKFNLDDLYVRFFRIAERRIEKTGRGIICYISSYSYLSDRSFVVARQNLLKQFDRIWIDSLNGDSRETGKRTPTGDPDPSVFSTDYNRAGITLGTSVGLFLKHSEPADETVVTYRDLWGTEKRQELLDSVSTTPFDGQYETADPQEWNWLSFRPPGLIDDAYLRWPKLRDLATLNPVNGLMEKRGGALMDIDRAKLAARMKTYFDPTMDWRDLESNGHPLAKNAAGYNAEKKRQDVLATALFEEDGIVKKIVFEDEKIVRYIVRPFDVRYAYFTDVSTIWNRPRPELWTQYSNGSQFLMSRPSCGANPEGAPVFFTRCLGDNGAQNGQSYYFSFQNHSLTDDLLPGATAANLSVPARDWLTHLGLPNPDTDADVAATPWRHALAIGYAPQYMRDNAGGIAIDWPRIPMPNDRVLFDASVALGSQVEALLDSEIDVPGVISGNVAEYLRGLGGISGTDLRMTAGWGRLTTLGRVYPGRGKIEMRDWTGDEKQALCKGFESAGISEERGFALLGRAVDVYLNDTNFWRGVPEAVWDYVIGGHKVVKKWLSYREETILGRPLTKEEAREVTGMVRRLTVLILMQDQLDANYAACRDNAYSWPVS